MTGYFGGGGRRWLNGKTYPTPSSEKNDYGLRTHKKKSGGKKSTQGKVRNSNPLITDRRITFQRNVTSSVTSFVYHFVYLVSTL